jgi:outer membrane protein OmpA-like peptidoglycan-associated protein
MKLRITILIFLTATFQYLLTGQPANDHCSRAFRLSDVSDWCSSPRQFTTFAATPSGIPNPACFPSYHIEQDNDVWFRFNAIATTVNISVIGDIRGNPKGTLQFPQVAVYRGSCSGGKEIACISDSRGYHIVETFVNSLAVGETYYIRVDARNNKVGTFQLCINNYNPVPSPSSDCSSAVVLCDKSSFTVPSVQGGGRNTNELGGICLQDESSSAWYKWTCEVGGSLTFTLTPVNPADDLDFALYLLPNGVEDCSLKIPLRCMASGENVNEPYVQWAPCTGPTGLSASSYDMVEEQGCNDGDDNFLAPLTMEPGASYALLVNNYHNTGNGFSIQFEGTGTFVGPKAHFTVSKLKIETGEVLYVKNASTFAGGIKKWDWNFGVGAMPQTASGRGPHKVEYSSTGNKSISLSVETNNGCQVTKVRNLKVIEPLKKASPPPVVENQPEESPGVDEQASISEEASIGQEKDIQKETDKDDVESVSEENPVRLNANALVDTITKDVEYSVEFLAIIYFKADSFSLEEKDYTTLDEVLNLLKSLPDHRVIVEGHTNHIPSPQYCLELASNRADVVIQWFEQNGIERDRIIRKVFGKERLVNTKNRRRNQRVELKVVKRLD